MTIHVHQRDVMNDLATLHRHKRISDGNDFEWLKQVFNSGIITWMFHTKMDPLAPGSR